MRRKQSKIATRLIFSLRECSSYLPLPLEEEEEEEEGGKTIRWPRNELGATTWVVDTVGWQEEERDDQETFQVRKKHFSHKNIIFKKLIFSKDILRYLREEEFTHLSGILWCVIPNVRRDAALQRQARFIHRMARWDGGGGGRSVW